MLVTLFTLDYELHGNGDGHPQALMVEPTARLLDQFDRHGAKLTIMADVAEILRFRQLYLQTGCDDYSYERIAAQLRDAIARGHDVQLHLHASWFGARHENGRWHQDWGQYSFADLPLQTLTEYLQLGKSWLEGLLQPVDAAYRCNIFRAANWSMQPSENAIRALKALGFRAETSVFKWGRREGLVNFDYSNAPHPLLPWRAAQSDICTIDEQSPLWEIPIYAEHRRVWAFCCANRLYRAWLSRRHRLPRNALTDREPTTTSKYSLRQHMRWFVEKHAWKADFNQCTGRQLVGALQRAERLAPSVTQGIERYPFVLIGHSKLFTSANQRSLEGFLRYVAKSPSRFAFGRFADAFPIRLEPALTAVAAGS
ncbi:MAG: hypothetical protein WCO57_00195 [Verrucomicrobiota bacterium]